ncbi:MAG: hypothetical protein H0S85_11280 [Desulfovibrionaceae bacterium]|jgi:hypothetical protein|nr:hypothetical protein [Desulfovibrionaceae bacterium]
MDATGEAKQEKKIDEMASVVEQLDGGISRLPIKGVFRFAITEALKDFNTATWRDIGKERPAVREKFFAKICEHAMPRLVKLGFPDGKVAALQGRLLELNKKYTRN